MEQIQASIETQLALAKHAETWEWKDRPARDVLKKDWSDRKAGDTITDAELGDGVIYRDLIANGVISES